MKDCCENCWFWKYLGDKENKHPSGLCRRYAPSPELNDNDSVTGVAWPETFGDDWCGDFEGKPAEDVLDMLKAALRKENA